MDKDNYKKVKTALWVIMAANLLVSVIKIAVGLSCSFRSILADGVHSIADSASNIVGLIGIRFASKPVDKKHPYGHGKFEILASLFIGVMLGFMGFKLIISTILGIDGIDKAQLGGLELTMVIITILINSLVAVTEYRLGKKLKSTILITDSLHTRGDIFISSAIVAGVFLIKIFDLYIIDTVLSLGVSAAVLVSAWQIIRNCIDVLVDSAVVDGEEVRKMLMTIPGVYDIHGVKSRGDFSNIFIDLHAIVDPTADVNFCHSLSHRLERELKRKFGQKTTVNVHVEPDDKRHS